MVSLVASRSRAAWWTLLLLVCLTIVPGCCIFGKPQKRHRPPDTHVATPADGAAPTVRGRSRWFVQPTTTPGLAQLDVWVGESYSPATMVKMDVFWQVKAGAENYPATPQRVVQRIVSAGSPLDWYEYEINAHKAYVSNPTNPMIQVQVLVTNEAGATWSFHKLVPLDDEWIIFD